MNPFWLKFLPAIVRKILAARHILPDMSSNNGWQIVEGKPSLLIVQPWFTAIGHPAQSLLNTASVLGVDDRVSYLISQERDNNLFADLADQLGQYGHVETFIVPSSSIRTCTLLSLLALLRSQADEKFRNILFLDAHLVLLAAFWRWVARLVRPKELSVIYLMGPEKISNNWLARRVISSFLSRPDTKLLLRTEELAEAWRNAFPATKKDKIDVIPSLELVSMAGTPDSPPPAAKLEFGILGQIRPGKSIERLVPLFAQSPDIGRLTVAGTFISPQHEEELVVLRSYPHFINRYLKEEELVMLAGKQHYLVMLYDNWDARMEAATLYLAARVGRPVIVRGSGWCGRMVKIYHCGVLCELGDETENFFRSLPRPGDEEYTALLSGIARFGEEHSGPAWRQAFLDKIFRK